MKPIIHFDPGGYETTDPHELRKPNHHLNHQGPAARRAIFVSGSFDLKPVCRGEASRVERWKLPECCSPERLP